MNVFDDTTSAPGNASAAPDTIGSYRLIHELGRGGMGTVYLAVRDDDAFQKRVAIKVLRPGMDSEAIVRRFRHERQILASLQHPYIAGLLDGGTTAAGLPYLAMEYVEGQNIAEYCESRRLETAARLDLFRKVCAAVQHAHQNLVIHRDIKPANVLVTADGTPKLLDFGIAKLLNPEVGGHTLAPTVAGLYLMTPEYASPEQVRGEPVTTATDVYSLGVLLYELLTGRRPYRITSRAPADVAEVICSVTPERPSTAVTTPQTPGRADLTERLRRRLAGDLDNIVLKALSKEPDRRYASVDQFSEDIHRHLVGLPVIARKDTVRYRAAKFVRRNRAMVAAAVVAFAALVAAASLSTWQARVASRERQRAESRFDDVRQLANAYLFEFHDAIRDLPGSTAARQLLVTRGLQYLDKLAADAGDRADLRREVADAYVRVGDVQGRPLNPNLGDTAGAVASYEKALALYESLGARDSSDPLLRRGLATGLIRLSAIRTATGDAAKALELARDALGVLRGITSEAAAGAEVQRELAVAHSQVGDLLSATGDTEAALQERRTTLTIMERLVAVAPADLNNLRQLGVAYHKLGNSLGNPNYPNVGDDAGALDYLQRSGEVFRKALELAPNNATFRRNAAVIDSNISDVLAATGRNDEALARLRQAIATFRSLAEADPANVFAENDVSITTFKIGQMLEAAGQLDAAITEYERALAIHQRLAAADPGNAEFKEQIASDLDGLAAAQAKRGNRSAAIASHSQAISLTRELQRDDPGNVELQVAVALSLIGRGATLVRFGALERARDDYAEAVELLSRLERDEVIGGSDLRTLADARAELAKLPTP